MNAITELHGSGVRESEPLTRSGPGGPEPWRLKMSTDLEIEPFRYVGRNDFDGYIIDASLGHPLQFRKVVHRFGGNFDFFGSDPVTEAPTDRSILAVLHPGGQEQADAFYKKHEAEIDALFWGHHRYGVVQKKEDPRKWVGCEADKFLTHYLQYHPEDLKGVESLRSLCSIHGIRSVKKFHKLQVPEEITRLCLRMVIYLLEIPKGRRFDRFVPNDLP